MERPARLLGSRGLSPPVRALGIAVVAPVECENSAMDYAGFGIPGRLVTFLESAGLYKFQTPPELAAGRGLPSLGDDPDVLREPSSCGGGVLLRVEI